MRRRFGVLFLLFGLVLMAGCSSDEPAVNSISVVSIKVNGANVIPAGNDNVPIDASIVIVFNTGLKPTNFESKFSITPAIPTTPTFTYANQSSKVTVDLTLDYSTTYTIRFSTGTIGANGATLTEPIELKINTVEDDVIRSMAPCTSATTDCLQTMEIAGSGGTANFDFYSNYPILEENASWENLKTALIVVHGVGRNANDYFSYMTTTLNAENLKDEVILISPFFKTNTEADAGDYYWSSTGWREGQNSLNTEKISTFAVIDAIIEKLSNVERFPVLEKIIVTGHSSGALFAQLYGAANNAEISHPEFEYSYIVANSQFFYYPDDNRISESTGQFYTPDNCVSYNLWPFGYSPVPPYLTAVNKTTFNNQLVNRSLIYLLGNGSQDDPTLNTEDCYATLLGPTRYTRGENMFSFMNLTYAGTHAHTRVIVNGIGHDGQGMYQSSEFKILLNGLVEE